MLTQIQSFVPMLTYYFVAALVPAEGPRLGGDYFTFVVIGVVSIRVLVTGLADLSSELDTAIQQGRFEMLLVEPVRWRFLPFAMVQWSFLVRLITVAVMILGSLLLGAHYRLAGVPMAILLTVVGTAATLAIGLVAMSVKVLSKRSDPVMAVYLMLGQVLSGAYFPLQVLPRPLRLISYLLPQTYVIAGNRRLLMPGGSEQIGGPSSIEALIALVAFCVVAYTIALWILGRTMEYARRIGVLGGY